MQGINSALLASFYSDYLSAAKVSGLTCSGTTFTPQQLKAFAASQVCLHLMTCLHKFSLGGRYICFFYSLSLHNGAFFLTYLQILVNP